MILDRLRTPSATPDRAVLDRLHRWKRRYPESLHAEALRAEARDVYHYELLRSIGGPIVDLGGGFATHNLLLAEDGIDVTIVDTFAAYWSESKALDPSALVALFEEAGVRMVDHELRTWDPVAAGVSEAGAYFSAHCLEHFHSSPLPLLRACVSTLRPGGQLVVCVPNAVNARKRVAVLRGHSNLAPFDEFFLNDGPFYGHVREFSVDDLARLGSALGLDPVEVYGRNWLGLARLEGRVPAPLFSALDHTLRLRPGLCSDIYLRGTRSSA